MAETKRGGVARLLLHPVAIFAGLIAGGILGWVDKGQMPIIGTLGDIYIRLLQMVRHPAAVHCRRHQPQPAVPRWRCQPLLHPPAAADRRWSRHRRGTRCGVGLLGPARR